MSNTGVVIALETNTGAFCPDTVSIAKFYAVILGSCGRRYGQAIDERAKELIVYADYYWVLSFDCKGTSFYIYIYICTCTFIYIFIL